MAEAARRGWHLGTTVRIHENVGTVDARLTVVATYRQVPGPYWFGVELSGGSAATSSPVMDDFLTDYATMVIGGRDPKGAAKGWTSPVAQLDLPVRAGQVSVAEFQRHRGELTAFVVSPNAEIVDPGVPQVTASSGLLDIARSLELEEAQSRVTVPLLMAQLVLVLTCVLWLVLVALTEQRTGELALARLRGRSPSLARMVLLRESRPPILAGMLGGVMLAVLVSYAVRHWWLDHDPSISYRASDAAWFAAAALFVVCLALLSVRPPARQPIAALLRAVPARAPGFVLGTVEAMVVAVGVAAYVAVLTGQLHGAVAGTIPAALAAATGVVGARLTGPVFAALGRRALRRGNAAAAAARLEAARRPIARWTWPRCGWPGSRVGTFAGWRSARWCPSRCSEHWLESSPASLVGSARWARCRCLPSRLRRRSSTSTRRGGARASQRCWHWSPWSR